MRNRLRKHGPAQMFVREADRKGRNLRTGLHQFPEFGDFNLGLELQDEGAFVRSG